MGSTGEDFGEAVQTVSGAVCAGDNAPRAVATYTMPYQADFAQFRLAVEGIRSVVADAAMAGWFWHYSNAVGGVKLLVAARDVPRALAILDERGIAAAGDAGTIAPPADAPPIQAAAQPEPAGEPWTCPNCGESVPGGWDLCWACGRDVGGEVPLAEEDVAPTQLILDGRDTTAETEAAAPGATERLRCRWECGHCGVRVPNEIDACWACGTTQEGQVNPGFATADAPIVERDANASTPICWPALCLACPPLLIYDLLLLAFADRPSSRPARRVSVGLLSRPMIRACLFAIVGFAWFPPLALGSVWILIFHVPAEKGFDGRRQRRFCFAAMALNFIALVQLLLCGCCLPYYWSQRLQP